MAEFYLLVAVFLFANLLVGLSSIAMSLIRVHRLLALQLLGTTTAAIIVLLAESLALAALRDVALLFTLLAALISVAFVRLSPSPEDLANDSH